MTTVTPLPTPVPSRQDPINFSTRADEFLGALPTFGTELNLVAGEVNTNALNAATSASTATTQASIATTQASIATTKANEATTARNEAVALTESYQGSLFADPTLDKNGNPLSEGDWYVNSSTGLIRVYTGGVWATSVSATAGVNSINSQQGNLSLKTINTNSLLGPGNIDTAPNLPRSARTSNLQITVSDKGTLIDITGGTFTQTFASAATLGNGWFCYIRNSGTGDITLDPNSSETIDGLSSYIMYPGEVRLVQCDGVALRSVVLNSFYKVFTASGTFIKPPGYTAFEGFLWAGGGGGRRGAEGSTRYGGMGGGCCPIFINPSLLSDTETVVIGSGGGSATVDSTNGGAGGNSTFSIFLAQGGSGGTDTRPSVGRVGAFFTGNSASHVIVSTSLNTNTPGIAFYGGGEGSFSSVFGGAAGRSFSTSGLLPASSSIYGGAGGDTNAAGSSPQPGATPGGGGGASSNGTDSGAGARGELRIWGLI